jgi:hypothetical protein
LRKLIAICVALGALSLLLPSEPSYDPWAWLVWGREVAHLDLNTHGGPSWKPLPVLFTTLFSPFSKIGDGIPPALWLVVARAGALLALALAFRLAYRLAGGPRAVRVGAGATAVVALLLTPLWIRYMAHGNEAPMAIAFVFWALERHLDGRRDHALILGFLACLLRPEVFPFLAVYGGLLFWREPAQRRLVVGLALALPVLWLVPEWIGSGNPLGAGQKATGEPPWSLSRQDKPWLAALERVENLTGLALELGAVAALVIAALKRERAVLGIAGVALAWVALIVVMTQTGFTGNSRYFLVPLALVCVLGGVGAAKLVQLVPRAAAQAAVAALVLVAAGLYVQPRLNRVDRQVDSARKLARLQANLETAIDRAGGAGAVLSRGDPTVNRGFVTRMAWEVKVPIHDIEKADGQGFVFAAHSRQAGRPPRVSIEPRMTELFRQGQWSVLRGDGPSVASTPGA